MRNKILKHKQALVPMDTRGRSTVGQEPLCVKSQNKEIFLRQWLGLK